MRTRKILQGPAQFVLRHPWIVGSVAVGGIAMGVYLPLLPSDPAPADGAGFALAAFRLGQPHLPYPIHSILGFLFTKLPLGTVAWRVGLLSAAAGAGTAVLVYLLALQIVKRLFSGNWSGDMVAHFAAGMAAMALTFSLSFWSASETAEVYALNALLFTGMLALFLLFDRTGRIRFLYASALIYALSLGLHYFNIVYLPALVTFVAVSRHRGQVLQLRQGGWVAAWFALGLAQFIYLPLRPLGPPLEISTLGAYWNYNLGPQVRQILEGSGSLWNIDGERVLGIWGAFLSQEFLLPGIALAAIGAWEWWRRRPREFAFVAALFALNRLAVFPVLDDPFARDSFPFFFIPSNIIVALCIGLSVAALSESLRGLRPWPQWAILGLFIPPVMLLIGGNYAAHRTAQVEAKASAAESSVYAKTLLRYLPPDSVVLSDWRFGTPLWYHQTVDRLNPNVQVFALWPGEWDDWIAGASADQAIYLTHQPASVMEDIPAARFFQYNWMTAYKVVRPSDYRLRAPPVVQHRMSVNLANQVEFLGYSLEPDTLAAGQAYRVEYLWRARVSMKRDFQVFAHFLDEEGRLRFQQDHQPVGGVFPTSRWAKDDIVRESYVAMVPEDIPAGAYTILVGMWDPADGARLNVVGSPGEANAITLDGIIVTE